MSGWEYDTIPSPMGDRPAVDYSVFHSGPVHPALLITFAFLPVVIIMLFVNHMDKKEKESIWLILGVFACGAASVPLVMGARGFSELLITRIKGEGVIGEGLMRFLQILVVTALLEELCKYLATAILTWNSREFNYTYDGIVYGVTASLGFICVDNIIFVLQNGLGAALTRMVTEVPMHAALGVYMGFYYGKAKAGLPWAMTKSILIPVILHVVYDYLIYLTVSVEILLAMPLILFTLGLFSMAFNRILESSQEDRCLLPLADQSVNKENDR